MKPFQKPTHTKRQQTDTRGEGAHCGAGPQSQASVLCRWNHFSGWSRSKEECRPTLFHRYFNCTDGHGTGSGGMRKGSQLPTTTQMEWQEVRGFCSHNHIDGASLGVPTRCRRRRTDGQKGGFPRIGRISRNFSIVARLPVLKARPGRITTTSRPSCRTDTLSPGPPRPRSESARPSRNWTRRPEFCWGSWQDPA